MARKTGAKKTAASRAAAETSASDATDTPVTGARRARAGTPVDRAPGRANRPVDPRAIPATASEFEAARRGKEKPDSKQPAPRPRDLGFPLTAPAAERPAVVSPSAEVVDVISDERRQPKGYREETVVATRMGYYGLKRRRAGEVFVMAFASAGYLPSWVRLADKEDKDPEVARSRQVVANSTGQEIRDDVSRDAGTEVPTYLGGNQRRPTNQSGDVL